MTNTATSLWERIQETYEDANAPEIARLTGKTKQTVYRWRDGDIPPLEVLVEICKSRRVSLSWLAMNEGPKSLNGSVGLEEGEVAIYFGPKEHEIIQKLAGESKRAFEDEVRELLLEKLEDKGLVTTKTGESNLIFFGDAVPKMVELPFLGEIAAGEPLMIFERDEKISVPDFAQKRGKKYMVLRVRGDSMIDDGILDGALIICEVRNTATPGETIVAVIDGNSATVKKYYPERGRIRLQPSNAAHLPLYVSDDRLKIQGIAVAIFHKPS
jgi:repressor LexA